MIGRDSGQNIYLPDDFLADIINDANSTAKSITTIYEKYIKSQNTIKKILKNASLIKKFQPKKPEKKFITIGIDGGRAHEHLLLFDIGIVSAIAIEGIQSHKKTDSIKFKSWKDIIPHYGSDIIVRVTKGIMHLFELELAIESKADYVLLDGRFITPIIGFNSIATIQNPDVLIRLEKIFENKNITRFLEQIFTEKNVVAIQKYDSSHNFSNTYLENQDIYLDDRALFSLILKENEYTKPVLLSSFPEENELLSNAHINLTGNLFTKYTDIDELKSFLSRLPDELYVSYFKPRPWTPALKIEIPAHIAKSQSKLDDLFQCIKSEIISAEMIEPFPLYLADIMAKSVSQGLSALKEAAKSIVQNNKIKDPIMFFESYRSE